jgi:peptidoglycan/xylan/chitin deacetylase (PgdA/CDA1 family)
VTLLVSTSWDDGHPLDRRLAERLSHHGIGATFYCPVTNREGLPTMGSADWRALAAAGFEIGGHTHDHAYASRTAPQAWAEQVRRGKAVLADARGAPVPGFAYPGGEHGAAAREAVRASGHAYARTIDNLHGDCGPDAFRMPTTLQVYPHPRDVLARNYVRRGQWRQRAPLARLALAHATLDARLDALLAHGLAHGGVLHVWGHSWEIEQCGLWAPLECCLSRIAAAVPRERRLTNAGVLQRAGLIA